MFNMIKSFLNPGKGYQKAQNQLTNYYNQGQNYLQPYSQNAQSMYGNLSGAVENLLNPSQLLDQWMNDYEMSDMAKLAQNRAMDNGMSALSSMGLLGSTPGIQAIQAMGNEIAAQDEQRFIERMINQYMQGAQLAQGIYGTGANAGQQLSNNANQMGQNSAEMAYGRQNAPGQLFGSLLGTGSNLAGAYMGMQGMNNMADSWKTMGGK